jgi:hypothetical protein
MKGFPNKSYYGKHVEIDKIDNKPSKARLERRKRAKEKLNGRKPFDKPSKFATTKTINKSIDAFEAEYQKFVDTLKSKKDSDVIELPTVNEPEPEMKLAPIEVYNDEIIKTEVEQKPKKTTRKKKVVVEEPVEEFFVSEQPTIDGLD